MIVGYDAKGIKRVYGRNEQESLEEALAYLRGRPDTGPLSAWDFRGQVQDADEKLARARAKALAKATARARAKILYRIMKGR